MKNLIKLGMCIRAIALLSVVAAFVSAFIPKIASAHVKWFVDESKVITTEHGLTPFYYLTSKEVVVWAVVAALAVILFSIFDRIIPEPKKLKVFGERNEKGITRVVQILVGLLLVSITFLWHIILVPEFKIDSVFTVILEALQLGAGLLLIFNVLPRFSSAVIAILYICMGIFAGWMPFVENIILLAVTVYIFIKNSPKRFTKGSVMAVLDRYSVEIVRIGTGVSLIVLAFTEKLMYPELSLSFLDSYQWNFMQLFGMGWFSNNLFVLSAGFVELIFGIIYILGYLTRINTLIMSCFFGMSVVTMFIQFGKWEMEDLIVYAAAVIFIFYGYGKTRFFHSMPESSVWRKRNILNLFKKI